MNHHTDTITNSVCRSILAAMKRIAKLKEAPLVDREGTDGLLEAEDQYHYWIPLPEGELSLRGDDFQLELRFEKKGLLAKLRRKLCKVPGDFVYKARDSKAGDTLESRLLTTSKEYLADVLFGRGTLGSFQHVSEIYGVVQRAIQS